VQALHIGPTWQSFSYFLPVFATIPFDSIAKHEILFLGPMSLGVLSMVII
jgi:hypothetical protein